MKLNTGVNLINILCWYFWIKILHAAFLWLCFGFGERILAKKGAIIQKTLVNFFDEIDTWF